MAAMWLDVNKHIYLSSCTKISMTSDVHKFPRTKLQEDKEMYRFATRCDGSHL